MTQLELTVNKAKVYDEVAKTTSYTGQKMVDDKEAYQRETLSKRCGRARKFQSPF